jgi:hypothetical protein
MPCAASGWIPEIRDACGPIGGAATAVMLGWDGKWEFVSEELVLDEKRP